VQAATVDVRFLREWSICQKRLAGASTTSVSYRLTTRATGVGISFQ
jgi:hypothetical protein